MRGVERGTYREGDGKRESEREGVGEGEGEGEGEREREREVGDLKRGEKTFFLNKHLHA